MTEVLSTIEYSSSPRDNLNQVSEEAIQRAQEENKQAKQVAQQIQQDKASNQTFATFLSLLLKKITDEQLISAIYNTFFKTINPQNNITYLRKEINTKVIVGFFVPFFLKEAQECQILSHYLPFQPESAKSGVKSYIAYLEQLSETYHDNIPIDQNAFLKLVILIIQHYLPNAAHTNLKNEILNALHQRA